MIGNSKFTSPIKTGTFTIETDYQFTYLDSHKLFNQKTYEIFNIGRNQEVDEQC